MLIPQAEAVVLVSAPHGYFAVANKAVVLHVFLLRYFVCCSLCLSPLHLALSST